MRDSMRTRGIANVGVLGLLAASLMFATTAGRVAAGDYSDTCVSADKRYEGSPGALYRATDKQQTTKLTYAILEEQVLEERKSTCLPSNPEARGATFKNYFRKTRQTVVIDDGAPRNAVLICELAASGLPAAFNCDRETVELDTKKPGPVKSYRSGAPGTWTHNGSVMRLEAEGAVRRIYYANPRDGIRQAGVSGDTLLFEGERQGNRYVGTARIFKPGCGEQTFPVEGTVSADDSRIVLTGKVARFDQACGKGPVVEQRLVFERR